LAIEGWYIFGDLDCLIFVTFEVNFNSMQLFKYLLAFSALSIMGKAAFAQNCDTLFIHLETGIWAEEISWTLVDLDGIVVDEQAVFENETTYDWELCIEPGCYHFILADTYGDGWQGGEIWAYNSADEQEFYGTLPDGFDIDIPMSHQGVCGCTNLNALNFDSTANFEDGSCLECSDNYVILTLSTGIWAEEISWEILNDENVIVESGIGYLDNTTYTIPMCLPDNCYRLHMYDSFGDGWQGGQAEIHDAQGNFIVGGTVAMFEGQAMVHFSLDQGCEIPGCMIGTASNYSPTATYDNGGCQFISDNIDLLGQWTDETLENNGFGGPFEEVYGLTVNGREFGVIGSTAGTHIIDVTDPENCVEVALLPGAFNGPGVTHRDFHTHGDYLYAVCDQGASTLQAIDVSGLPGSAFIAYDSNELLERSHNIFIDTLTSKLYAVSASGNLFSSPLLVIDISNPLDPVLLHDMDGIIPSTHDIHVENDLAFINCVGAGMYVYDFSGETPLFTGALTEYPDQGTNHSCWVDHETGICVFADETHGATLKVCDVSDVTDIQVLSMFSSGVNPESVAHNLFIKDHFVFVSYYHDGLQVFDISDPYNPQKVAYYDTFPNDTHVGFQGAWGVYPNLPSGNILISDMKAGLFVLEFTPPEGVLCEGETLQLGDLQIAEAGFYTTVTTDSLGYDDMQILNVTEYPVYETQIDYELTFGDSILIEGEYIMDPGVYNVNLTSINGCDSLVVYSVDVIAGCSIGTISVGTQTPCSPGAEFYSQEVTFEYFNEPLTGTVNLNGQSFSIDGSAQTVVLIDLPSDFIAVDLTIYFSAASSCTTTIVSAWIAAGQCCVGDLNGDQIVNAIDLLIFLSEIGCSIDCDYDLTGDGVVDTQDLLLFLGNFGQICS
ncbi:MAG: choice-of-anchor B domain-containing protein, partial [Gammaproteobacteria bacterium]